MERNNDLCVTTIQTVYDLTTFSWSRPTALPRHTNALVYFLHGSIRYVFPDHTCTAHPGDVLLLPKNIVYRGQRLEESNRFLVIDFETLEDGELEKLNLPRLFPGLPDTGAQFRQILECWERGDMLRCRELIYRLVQSFTRQHRQDKRVSLAISLMRQNLSDPELSLDALCHRVCVSQSHLRRLFHRELRQSPMQYLTQLRMLQARAMLAQGDLPISDVARSCGYGSLYYFSRDFKEKNGMNPSLYRKQFRI